MKPTVLNLCIGSQTVVTSLHIHPLLMHLPEDGHEWPKHVGSILCLLSISIHLCAHVGFVTISHFVCGLFGAIVSIQTTQIEWWMNECKYGESPE